MRELIDRQAALDAIKFAELGREYDEVEKVQIFNPWHRVEEPPKIGVPVLVTFIGYHTGETKCDLLAAYDGITWRYWDGDMLDEVVVEITHWMPLPEPPKEDE